MKSKFMFTENESPYRQEVINKIWDIAKMSPEHGNALMDILGEPTYEFVMRNHTICSTLDFNDEKSLEETIGYHKGYLDALNKVANSQGGIDPKILVDFILGED